MKPVNSFIHITADESEKTVGDLSLTIKSDIITPIINEKSKVTY